MKWISPALAREFASVGTDTYRVADAEGLRIERFGDGAIISHMAEKLPSDAVANLKDWCLRAEVSISRIYGRRLVSVPERSAAPRVIGDVPCNHVAIAREEGLCYEIDFSAGYSCGFFIDQRANRRTVRAANSGRMLNLFAYTCSFSVVAAMAGLSTLSVDLSKSALEWGRRNFRLNNLTLDGHRFLADDVLDVLPRLARRGEKFDWIIVDPPTFSRGRGGRLWRAEIDYGRMIELTNACAAPGAMILLSSNSSTLRAPRLRALARKDVSDSMTFIASPQLPDIPAEHGAATVWMRIEK
ncbi:MAG TPA: class I SAM-dependent methyltransferase [Terrimicrobiaceae bacterium]